jgi:hypothetical protein
LAMTRLLSARLDRGCVVVGGGVVYDEREREREEYISSRMRL